MLDTNLGKGELKMKDKIFGVLQRVGRSFMLPIALLPVAGLLLGIAARSPTKRCWRLMA
jgi:hypothetical protein